MALPTGSRNSSTIALRAWFTDLPAISATSSSNPREFAVRLDLSSGPTEIDLSVEILDGLGLTIDQPTPLELEAELALEFVFGLDEADRFFVSDPGLDVAISIDHAEPLALGAEAGEAEQVAPVVLPLRQ